MNGILKVNGKDQFVQVKIEQNMKVDLKFQIYPMKMIFDEVNITFSVEKSKGEKLKEYDEKTR